MCERVRLKNGQKIYLTNINIKQGIVYRYGVFRKLLISLLKNIIKHSYFFKFQITLSEVSVSIVLEIRCVFILRCS